MNTLTKGGPVFLVGSNPLLSGPNMTTKTPERRARSHRRRLRRSGAVKGPERLGREVVTSVCEEHGQSQCDRCRHYSEDDGVVISQQGVAWATSDPQTQEQDVRERDLQVFKRTKWFSQEDADRIIANKGRMPATLVMVSFGDGVRFFDECGVLNNRLLSEDDDRDLEDRDLEDRVNEIVSDFYCGYDFEYKKVP